MKRSWQRYLEYIKSFAEVNKQVFENHFASHVLKSCTSGRRKRVLAASSTVRASWLLKFTTAEHCFSKFWLLFFIWKSFCLNFGPVESWLLISQKQAQNADQLISLCTSQRVKKAAFSSFAVPVATATKLWVSAGRAFSRSTCLPWESTN